MTPPDNKALADRLEIAAKIHEDIGGQSALAATIREAAAALREPSTPSADRDREADRRRFSDPAFNRWLDEGISDAGHTVWSAVGDVQAAWAGWDARQFAGDAVLIAECCGREECGGECGNEWRGMGMYRKPSAPSAQAGEVVAWRRRHHVEADQMTGWIYSTNEPNKRYAGSEYQPLYTTPQPQGDASPSAQVSGGGEVVREALARAIGCGYVLGHRDTREGVFKNVPKMDRVKEHVWLADDLLTGDPDFAAIAALSTPQARPSDDDLWDQTLTERDQYAAAADTLAELIANITGADIGEHSSANSPWDNAIEAAEGYIAKQARPDDTRYLLNLIDEHGDGRSEYSLRAQHMMAEIERRLEQDRPDGVVCGKCGVRQPLQHSPDCGKPAPTADGGAVVDRALVAFHQHESGPCEFPDRKNPEFNANQRERMAAALAAVQRGQLHDGCGCDSSEGEACEKCCPSMRPQVSHSGEPFGHLYRVVVGPDHPSAHAPWSGKDTVFEAGPAPVEGVRGSIQYRNLYHPTPAPDVARLVEEMDQELEMVGPRAVVQLPTESLRDWRDRLAPFTAAQQEGK